MRPPSSVPLPRRRRVSWIASRWRVLVGEELQRDRRGVEPFLAAALDDGTGDGRELVDGDGFDDRHAGDLSFSVLAH